MHPFINFSHFFSIPSYNFFIAVGLVFGLINLENEKKYIQESERQKDTIKMIIVVSIIFGFIGAYVFDSITQNKLYTMLSRPNEIGLTFWGGFILGLIVLICISYYKRLNTFFLLNLLSPSFLISHFWGRLGCFFVGCCFGKETNAYTGIIFPKNSIPYSNYHGLVSIHPTQLYEATGIFILLVFLRKQKFNNRFFLYLILYGILRFFIEFLRGDNRGSLFNQNILSPSQLISMLMCCLIITLVFFIRRIPNNILLATEFNIN